MMIEKILCIFSLVIGLCLVTFARKLACRVVRFWHTITGTSRGETSLVVFFAVGMSLAILPLLRLFGMTGLKFLLGLPYVYLLVLGLSCAIFHRRAGRQTVEMYRLMKLWTFSEEYHQIVHLIMGIFFSLCSLYSLFKLLID